jgi:outer membrane protein
MRTLVHTEARRLSVFVRGAAPLRAELRCAPKRGAPDRVPGSHVARNVNGCDGNPNGADIVKSIQVSLLALMVGAGLLSAPPALAQAPSGEAQTFDDLIAAELGTGGGLTADEAGRRASQTSPTARARNEDLAAAAADVDRALAAFVPRVVVSASYTRLSDTKGGNAGSIVVAPGAPAGPLPPGSALVNVPLAFDTPLNQYALQASISVPLSDYFLRISPQHASARHGEAAAAKRLRAERIKAAADARINYYDWVRARLNMVVAEQSLSQARAHRADAKTGLEAGTLSNADFLRIESEVAKSELLLESTRNLVELTEEQLRTSMHDPSGAGYRIGEDVRRPAPQQASTSLRELWAEAQRSRPELSALDEQRAAQERATAAQRAAYLPRLELVGNASYSNPNSRIFPQEAEFRGSWDAGARATWVLSDLPDTAARLNGAGARIRAMEADRAALADQIHMQVMSAFKDLTEARVAEGTTARRLAAAEESYRTRRLLFQNGRATTVELLDAETDLTRARLEALGARIDGRVAHVRLAYAVGRADRP